MGEPQENLREILEKYDPESRHRHLTGLWAQLIRLIAIAFSCFQLYTAIFGTLDDKLQRPTHLMFALALIFLLYPFRRQWDRQRMHWADLSLASIAVATGVYCLVNYEELVARTGAYTPTDVFIAVVGVLLVLEATRRIVGPAMVIVATAFLLYSWVGPLLPGVISHRGYSLERIFTHMYFTTEGILGIPLGVSATFIFLFILFGAFLEKTGIGKFFIDLANAVAGGSPGGPAKVAVFSSALFGTVSGSSVANVVGTGTFSIPLMKSLGYKPEFAGAVEAASSTGGQLMPPIMGAAAFLMAEFIGIKYVEVAKAAVLPAVLYFAGIWIMVDLEARKLGLRGLPKEQLPLLGRLLRERGYLVLPLIGIIYFLVSGYTPMRAALGGLALTVLTGFLKREGRLTLRDLVNAMEQGARGALSVAAACACAGIIVGTVTLTGLGLKMGDALIALAGGRLLFTLFFTMLTSLILGMGAPTTANYVITSTIAAPAIVKLGVPKIAAHLFAFYFGIIADITPPVALAAFAGSAIAKANPFKTGVNATKLAIAAWLVPYIFVFNPVLVLVGATPGLILRMAVTSLIGMVAVGAAVQGYLLTDMSIIERVFLFVGGIMLIDPGFTTDVMGLVVVAAVFLVQRHLRARRPVHS
ncbi:MAG TPA: TRAP transporter permease [Firmicutes bacterium]|nr:TRAP transporter permease [Bacillota bacterium]